MRILNKYTKILILAVLGCSFLIACDNNSKELAASLGLNYAQLAPDFENVESVWSSMSKQFELNHHAQYSQVKKEIRVIQRDPRTFYHILEASEPYIYYILQETHQRGLPAELALLPVIESEYNPYDRETTGATGLWQLMPDTASGLGVKMNYDYDGRMNVIDSTKAALRFLKYLGDHFRGNWALALAAYDWGPGNVDSATRRSGTRNYWDLDMPTETALYVPRLLAVAEIVQHPGKYGIQLPPVKNKPYFAEVKINKPVNLIQIAKKTGVNTKALVHLNSAYREPSNSISSKNHTILLPLSKAKTIQTKLVDTGIVQPKNQLFALSTKTTLEDNIIPAYVVQPGDDIEEIAKQFHISVKSLMKVNHLKDTEVFPGQKLIIPNGDEHLAANFSEIML